MQKGRDFLVPFDIDKNCFTVGTRRVLPCFIAFEADTALFLTDLSCPIEGLVYAVQEILLTDLLVKACLLHYSQRHLVDV